MKCSSVAVILILNTFCAFSQVPHDITYVMGCFVNGSAEILFEFDGEEMLYADFPKKEIVYTVPRFIDPDPGQVLVGLSLLKDALDNKEFCLEFTELYAVEEKHPQEEKDPPEAILFPSEDVELGVENTLICLVNYFYPPSIKVSWTKNDQPISVGTSLSRYYPNDDQTFRQFSTLTFTPSEGDVYSCTVEHSALETPRTRIWDVEIIRSDHQNLGPYIFCGVGLSLGLLGFATGIFFIVKGHHQ
ncbi:RLA class II histocompatibility antigen, DP alpha-1 chain-like [Mugil cephalus]|uniref:RLA class II histocompatibility antigen, DP alpha-1 chain-like n=1 Tax=Mugil cephalus TaxID=48193 RepID=UPI001FB7058E|nr:RLA class II histocompatibility antigen, DP alpha-1 chain-like [Mugil cephalus]